MIYTVILKSVYPEEKLDYGSLIWRKEGVRQKKNGLQHKNTVSICTPKKVTMAHYRSINNLVFKRGG